jgi:cysteine desulfurase
MQEAVGEADYNPASAHAAGVRASESLEEARRELASLLGADHRAIVFTAGGTASDNLAVLGFARANSARSPRLVVSATEHKAVLEAARQAVREGAELHVLDVDGDGRVRVAQLESLLKAEPARPTLVSVMWANNEVGTIQPVAELCRTAHRYGAVFHTDAVQAFGKLPVSLDEVRADMLTMTAHKLGGPVGIGLLYLRPDLTVEPLSYGGSQERSLWPGTQNPLGALGFAAAARLAAEGLSTIPSQWRDLRDGLAHRLQSAVPDLHIHGDGADRLPNLLSVGVPGCDQASLLVSLDLAGVAVSGGSACASGATTVSHVLEAMDVRPKASYAVLRFSFGPDTSAEEVYRAGELTGRAVSRIRGAGS